MIKIICGVISSLFLLITLNSCNVLHVQQTTIMPSVPYGAFVHIRSSIAPLTITVCDFVESCTQVIDNTGLSFSASGVVVATSKLHSNRQYVMTAGHLCTAESTINASVKTFYASQNKFVKNIEYVIELSVNTDSGETYIATVVGLDEIHDLCIIAIDDSYLEEAKISTIQQQRGDEIYVLAAPLASWQPGTTHRFDGYYSGVFSCAVHEPFDHILCDVRTTMWSLYTFPATHGSSGAPILSKNHDIVGIVVAVLHDFEQIVWAANSSDMKRLLDEVIKAEFDATH